MENPKTINHILHLLGRIAEAHTTAAICVAEIRAIVDRESNARVRQLPDFSLRPIVDYSTRSVSWAGNCCRFGPTLIFDLLGRLARRPNQYVTHQQLLVDVWKTQVSIVSIRSAIRDLRSRLRRAGMSKLASAIEGKRGCYGLILDPPP